MHTVKSDSMYLREALYKRNVQNKTYVVVGSEGRTEHPVYPAALGCVSHDMNVNAQQIPNSVLKPSNKRERRDHSNK